MTNTSKAEIQQQLESQMRELQTQIEQLNGKMEQAGEEARNELERSLNDLKARNAKAETQLNELREASDEILKTLATDIETYWSAFTGAVNNVFIEADKANSGTASTVQTDVSDASEVHEEPSSATDTANQ